MTDSDLQRPARKPMHFGWALIGSLVIFSSSLVIDQTVRWSNPLDGLLNGLYHVLILGIAWPLYLLPWSLVVFGLYRWRKWQRFRTAWILMPALMAFSFPLFGLIADPPDPLHRFEKFNHVPLRRDIAGFRSHLTGGGVTDYTDTYFFRTSSNDVERLVSGMDMKRSTTFAAGSPTPVTVFPGWPDYRTWNGLTLYRQVNEKTGWFHYLLNDAAHEQVYILVGCF